MLGYLDRQMIFNYVKAYLVCLTSLLGLFIVVDLFTNLDEFTSHRQGLAVTLQHVGVYYGSSIPKMFDRLCEAISLLAAVFTVAWMQRNNELLPRLSAGVSTRRVVLPVLIGACGMLGMAILNQEFVLPRVDNFVVENRDNLTGAKGLPVRDARDVHDIHFSSTKGEAIRKELMVTKLVCVMQPRFGRDSLTTLQAETAVYVPPGDGDLTGGWMLRGTTPAELDNWARDDVLKPLGPGRYFLKTEIDFDTLIRSKHWYSYLSTPDLLRQMNRPSTAQLTTLAVALHGRLTRPFLGIVLVVLGLSVILRDQNRYFFVSAGLCLAVGTVFFGVCLASHYLGNREHIAPALAAWLPLILFGPISAMMFCLDVHT